MDKKEIVSICPNCGSLKIKGGLITSPLEQTTLGLVGKTISAYPVNPDFYSCTNCGYYGPAININKKDLKTIQDSLKANKNNYKYNLTHSERNIIFNYIGLFMFLGIMITIVGLFMEKLNLITIISFSLTIISFIVLIIFRLIINKKR